MVAYKYGSRYERGHCRFFRIKGHETEPFAFWIG